MQPSFAFLANYADVLRDGRLMAVGIDFEGVVCPQIPIVVPVMLVVKIKVDPSETDQSFTLGIEITRPGGKRESLGVERPFLVRANSNNPNHPSGSAMIAAIGLSVESEGEHLFHVLINGTEFKTLPLDIQLEKIDIQTVG